jgi:hypothetical protein
MLVAIDNLDVVLVVHLALGAVVLKGLERRWIYQAMTFSTTDLLLWQLHHAQHSLDIPNAY